jgi:hypothetical protein
MCHFGMTLRAPVDNCHFGWWPSWDFGAELKRVVKETMTR